MTTVNFWRTEIWHPLSVHFPIALLLVSTLIMLIAFILKGDTKRHWQNASSGLLFAGCLAAWIAVYTGNLADGIVARKICDPTILKDHEIAARTMAYLFTAAAALNICARFNIVKLKLRILASYLTLLLMVTGCVYLFYTSHLGASLVYQQGAGVDNHRVDCD